MQYLVPLRMTEEQPILIRAALHMRLLNVRSPYHALSAEYLEDTLICLAATDQAYLDRDAQTAENPDFVQAMDTLQAEMAGLEQQLAAVDPDAEPQAYRQIRERLESDRLRYEQRAASDDRYVISPQDLALYRPYGSSLFFQPPGIFDPSPPMVRT